MGEKNERDDFLWLKGEVNFSYLPDETKPDQESVSGLKRNGNKHFCADPRHFGRNQKVVNSFLK